MRERIRDLQEELAALPPKAPRRRQDQAATSVPEASLPANANGADHDFDEDIPF